jgi:hypothetical protein
MATGTATCMVRRQSRQFQAVTFITASAAAGATAPQALCRAEPVVQESSTAIRCI